MNNLINVINKMQEICVNSNINSKIQLPQIVVVGSQSSGKTSILEAIVGRDFLPRGSGIVTRRPLILQLKNVQSVKEWAEFLHTGKEKFEDFSKVLAEIEKETARVAGSNKGISSEPIILKIYSPNLLDLTLVDLPGVVKVPIGDQPENIDQLVRSLLLEYISNPNAIILAITPANADIANSDALKLAKEVDPFFQRTIGVVTKIDLMDHGTDALEILSNKVFPLKYGYIGVILRSQKDTNNKKSIQECLQAEQDFFDNHPDYKAMRHLLGVKNLSSSLSTILLEHIRNNLPGIKDTISTEIFEKEKELSLLGQDNGFDRADVLNSYVLMLVFKFTNTYKEIIEGNLVKECSKFFIGGARINYIFQEMFRKEIMAIDPFDTLSDDDIRTAIKNTNGLKPSLFIPEGAFEVLIKQQIIRFTNPSMMCVKRVYDELKNIVSQIELPELVRYKKFEVKIKQIMENVLDRCLEPTNQMISNLIDIEQSYINTSHPDFLGPEQSFLNIFDENSNNPGVNIGNNVGGGVSSGGSGINGSGSTTTVKNFTVTNYSGVGSGIIDPENSSWSTGNSNTTNNLNSKKGKIEENEMVREKPVPGYPSIMRPAMPNSRDVMETCIIKNLISSYYHVVKKNINDLVPKTIMCFLVNHSKMMAEKELVSQLFKSNELESLLQEDPFINKKRKNIKESLVYLKSSLDVITNFSDLSLD